MKRVRFMITALALVIVMTATGWALVNQLDKADKICISEQYGLAYAPLQIMKDMKLLEKRLPDIKIEWNQLSNTATIREAMLANQVDIGFMAIPPFLIGWDKGMEWKIASGLSESPVGLVTWKKEIHSLHDLTKNDRIALPQPGSVQHILLAMACEREFGDAKKFDNMLVTLAHPDGMNALLAKKEITAHFTAPPYLNKELENPELHQILDGTTVFGKEFTFIVGVTTEKFHNQNPRAYKAFSTALQEAISFVQKNPAKTAAILSVQYKIPEADLLAYLNCKGIKYTSTIKGVDEFAAFLKRLGYINKTPQKMSEILWESARYER
jgi:NitT/TauT family transport system substrate-binding protein